MSEAYKTVERPSRDELLAALTENRRMLSHEIDDLGHAVNVKERFETAFKKHAPLWLGGGFVAGVLLSILATPRKKVDREGNTRVRSPLVGLLMAGAVQGLRLARPAISALAMREVKKYVGAKMSGANAEVSTTGGPAAEEER